MGGFSLRAAGRTITNLHLFLKPHSKRCGVYRDIRERVKNSRLRHKVKELIIPLFCAECLSFCGKLRLLYWSTRSQISIVAVLLC